MSRVTERAHRQLETSFFSGEKMASAASFQGIDPLPQKELAAAQRDLALSQFHDLLNPILHRAGRGNGALRLLHHACSEICSRVKARAFFALAAVNARQATGKFRSSSTILILSAFGRSSNANSRATSQITTEDSCAPGFSPEARAPFPAGERAQQPQP